MSRNRRKRGKVSSVCLEEQKIEFIKYEDQLIDTDFLPSPSSKMFLEIRKNLSSRMSTKALYLSLKKNYAYFFDIKEKNDSKENLMNHEETYNSSSSSDQEEDTVVSIEFEIEQSDWQYIRPDTIYCSRRDINKPSIQRHKKTVLPKNQWTNIMSEILWRKTKRECTWIFKHSSAVDYNITFTGYCKQCGAKIKALSTEASENSAYIKCRIEEGDLNIIHNPMIKNKVTKVKKQKLSEKLTKENAIVLRNKIVNEVMNDDDTYEPPFVPSLKALQNIRQTSKQEKYYHKEVVMSLSIMAATSFQNVIRLFSVKPFILYYWSDVQEKYYGHLVDSKKRIKLSIDATGSIFKKLVPARLTESAASKHIFLYVAVVQTESSCVPITQMITDLHTLDNICRWLQTWRGNKKAPDEIVCDDSAALIGAITKAFTMFETTKEYIDYCFNILLNKSKLKDNHILIRLDTSHFIKTIYNYQCFRYVDIRVKKFYMQFIRKIKDSSSFHEIQLILNNLIVVALNKFTGNINGKQTLCQRSLEILLRMETDEINSDDVEHLEEGYINENLFLESDEDDDVENEFVKGFTHKVETVLLLAQISDSESVYDNLYYLPDFIKTLRRLISRLPLWSNVMLSYIDTKNITPTSSDVESYFKNLKTLLKSPAERLRIDDFIIKHNEYMSGELKKKYSDDFNKLSNIPEKRVKSATNKTDDDFSQESIMCDNPTLVENWKGQAVGKQKIIKRLLPSQNKRLVILSNGNSSPSGVSGLIVENTCAFDCVVQCLAVAYVDRMNVRKVIDTKTSGFMTLVKGLANNNQTINLYRLRANIINKYYYEKTITSDLTIVNCMTNVTFVLDKILIKDIPVVTSQKKCTNFKCFQNETNNQRLCSYMPLNELILSEGIAALEKSAQSMLQIDPGVLCERMNDGVKCFGKVLITYTICSCLLIFELDLEIDIKDIPDCINLDGKQFLLFAVVEYLSNIRHYVAHCKRPNNNWETYDDLESSVGVQKETTMVAHSIMYTISC